MDVQNFLFSLAKPCKYVHNILYVFHIYDDLHSVMFIHVLIYKTYSFSKYLRPFWVPGTWDEENKMGPPPPKACHVVPKSSVKMNSR